MGTIVNFCPGVAPILWSPKRGIKASWRILSPNGAIIPFRLPAVPVPVAPVEPPPVVVVIPKRTAYTDIVQELETEVERIIESEDRCFEDRICDYVDCIDEDSVLRCFLDNYSSRSVGIKELDTLEADEILELARTRLGSDTAVINLILECSEPETSDYYIGWNEVASVTIGEMEYQVDVSDHADLEALIAQATDEELASAGINDRDSFLVYGRPCERIVWKLDPEMLLERLAGLAKRA